MSSRILIALKGVCMGLADVIPGVSGGTMALILGIYDRLIAAFSILGPHLLRQLVRAEFWRRLMQALKPKGQPGDDDIGVMAGHVAFLINVFVGIVSAVLVGLKVLPSLLQQYPTQMSAFFLGLVLASTAVPYARIQRRTLVVAVLAIASLIGCWFLMGIQKQSSGGFARTTVTLQRTDGQPFKKSDALHGSWVQFHVNTEKKLRHNIAFSSEDPINIVAGEAQITGIPVVAKQAGAHANISATGDQPLNLVVSSVDPKGLAPIVEWSVHQETDAGGGTDPALWYVFICGAVAICAMLLPGVSGAFLLLMLGMYGYVVHQGHALVYNGDTQAVGPIAVFLFGIVLGLASFSRLLKWLLAHHHDGIMAVLIGLMLGSLRVLWPFRDAVSGDMTLPSTLDATAGGAIGAAVLGMVIVVVLSLAGRRAAPEQAGG
jgi:uncharacterized membrane protein